MSLNIIFPVETYKPPIILTESANILCPLMANKNPAFTALSSIKV